MALKEFGFVYKGRKISLKLKKCNFFQKIVGLMFKSRITENLLFEINRPMAIHSFFVFFPFIAIWLDKNNNVVEIKKVKPFQLHILPKKVFSKLLEIPINNRNKEILTKLGF